MPNIKLIRVESRGCLGELCALGASTWKIELDADPDNALERICSFFEERWGAKVHALRWIFPGDFLLPTKDESPFLVLHVDNPGKLTSDCVFDRYFSRCETTLDLEATLMAASRCSDSEPWSSPQWLADTSEWIVAAFGRDNVRRISQVRACSNGAVLRIETARDTYFMKTVPASVSHETKLLKTLDRCLPGVCPSLLPQRPDANTHLSRAIRGLPLRMMHDLESWKVALREVAQLQVRSISLIGKMKESGVPAQTLAKFAAGLPELLAKLISMQKGAPNELDPGELEKLPQLVENATCASEVLGECGIPEALVHGDLNESNLFVTSEGGAALIDWTFSRIGHPFFALGFSLFAVAETGHRMHACSEQLRGAYIAPWRAYASEPQLLAGLDAARRLFWIDTAQEIGRFVGRTRQLMPGTVAQLPVVLRCALSSFDLGV